METVTNVINGEKTENENEPFDEYLDQVVENINKDTCNRLEITENNSNISDIEKKQDHTENLKQPNENTVQPNGIEPDKEILSLSPNLSRTEDVTKHKLGQHFTDSTSDSDSEILLIKRKTKSKVQKSPTVLDSDSESGNKLLNRNTKKSIINFDSDSESKNKLFHSTTELNDAVSPNIKAKVRKRTTFLQSDSEDELPTSDFFNEKSSNDLENIEKIDSVVQSKTNIFKKKLSQNRFTLEESDSDNEVITPHNKSLNDNAQQQELPIFKTTSNGELVLEENVKPYNWSKLCDSESSADEEINDKVEKNDENGSMSEEKVKPLPYKRKRKSKHEKEPKEMTGKEAEALRKEIQSESQRMTREANVSLPYHRPKSFTFKEFLARRPKLTSAVALAAKTPSSIAIKMSVEQLEIVSKKLEERHKEVKEFYKSDSEEENVEEDKDDVDYVPPGLEKFADSIETANFQMKPQNNCDPDNTPVNNGDRSAEIVKNDNLDAIESVPSDESAKEIVNEVMEVDGASEINTQCDSKEAPVDEVIENNDNVDKEPETTPNNCEENKMDQNTAEDHLDGAIQTDEEEIIPQERSTEYEFNLEDVEDKTEKMTFSEDQEKSVVHKTRTDSFPHEDELIQNDCSELNEKLVSEKPRLSKFELIQERLLDIRPRLSTSRNDVIDLDDTVKPNEVTKLIERFVKHTAKKQLHKDKVQLNVVRVESGGEIHNETVAVHVDDEEDMVIEEKPGVRLKRLRNELQSQIAQQRAQLWQTKATKVDKDVEDETYEDEKSECGLFDNEEEEIIELDDDESDVEEEADEGPKVKSAFIDDEAEDSDVEETADEEPKVKSAFIDDEAEDSDAEELREEDEEEDSDEDETVETESKVSDNDDDNNKENKCDNTETDANVQFKKPLRRILKPFTEDSDDDEDIELTSTINKISEKLRNERSNSVTQDDYIPSYQIQNQNTPVKEKSKSDMKFLTPVSYITGLQNLTNSASKIHSPANVPSPLKEVDWHSTLQKKLFTDSLITDSQAEAMEKMCSETFPNTQDALNFEEVKGSSDRVLPQNIPSSLPPDSQDLLDICSGEFTGSSKVLSSDVAENSVTHILNAVDEIKSLGEDQDVIISQLIDEDEMEAFKKKFVSPILTHPRKVVLEPEEVAAGGGMLDSDDEGDVLEVKKKKKNRQKLTFSDDESSEDEEDEEEIDLHEKIEEDSNAYVNYDSEENEVEYPNEKEPQNFADFFDNEAELSESEWGSADEDERDLDKLEVELGDEEQFDEKRMRTDLERIHMRRMLDDDTRNVKLLQEMLLDDGELHGTGRERKFRWKNIDSLEIGDEGRNSEEEDTCHDEDESEELWRKKRHEREMFLKQKQSQDVNDEDDILSGSAIFKIGHRFVQKTNSQNNNPADKDSIATCSTSVSASFSFSQKRGSFLSRGDQVLRRLAEFNKSSRTGAEEIVQKTKNSKNFLFQTTANVSILDKKRKAAIDGTPKVIKKLRLSNNLSPAVNRKKKTDQKVKAKLFGIS